MVGKFARRRGAKGVKRAREKPKSKKKTSRKPVARAWSKHEIEILRSAYAKKPASQVAKELRRSLPSVRGKISALGLAMRPMRKRAGKKGGGGPSGAKPPLRPPKPPKKR